jgi:S-adenosylmethionine decarboxylase
MSSIAEKNFIYPEKQLFPHSSFKDECAFLDQYFQGSGYQLGKANGDHWFTYITDTSSSVEETATPDQTLEILMSELDPKRMLQFYKQGNKDFVSSRTTTEASGIADLFPGAIIDDYMFDPCGYSMNGLLGDAYFTIHITPQPQCSYASFETNASHKDYTELIQKVVQVFKPKNFFVTLFANIYTAPALDSSFPQLIGNCKKSAKMLCEFNNSYKLSFCQYVSDDRVVKTSSPVRPVAKSPIRKQQLSA